MENGPFFSVLVSAYNRARELERCIHSVLEQTFTDFEIVIVDDASTDDTAAVLAEQADPRVRVICHEHNRGISSARATAVEHARGEWFVVMDSDWELYPHSLARLRELIDTRPPDVRIIRSRLLCDDGSVDPGILPSGVSGYRERLRWIDEVWARGTSSDAGHCTHRSVFDATNYFHDRRGEPALLWETNLALTEKSLWVEDILGMQHADGAHSYTRDTRPSRAIPRLLRDAPDEFWMAETMLKQHGAELIKHAPHVHLSLLERATTHAFLSGDRRAGRRYARAALGSGSGTARVWTTLVLGMAGPKPLAYGKVLRRRGNAVSRQRRRRMLHPTAT